MLRRFASWLVHEDEGQDLVEYALLASFIAVASIAGLLSLGPVIASFYSGLVPYFN